MSLEITEELIARQPPEAQAIIRALLAKIEELQDRLNQSPRNSSLPPSTEHPHAKPPGRKPQATRHRGGQPGHPRHERPLLPTEQCDDVIPLKPATCRRCGRELSGEDAEPLRHQVWELPEIKPQVTEYQRHRLACPRCGETTCAALPPGVPAGQSGPRLVAFAGLLMAYFRQSKRRTALFLETLLKQPCCPGLTVKMQAQVTQALRPAYEELAGELPAQPAPGDRRVADQGSGDEGVAVDVRRRPVHGVRRARHAGRDGVGRAADGRLRRRGHVRPGQDVLGAGAVAVVLGPSETRLSGAGRQRRTGS